MSKVLFSSQFPSKFLPRLLDFCRKLKEEGVKVTLHQEIDACRSLQYINISNHNDFYCTLKTNLLSRREDIQIFDEIFFHYWDFSKKEIKEKRGTDYTTEDEPAEYPDEKEHLYLEIADYAQDDLKEEKEFLEIPAYSPAERLLEKDFSTFEDEYLEAIKKAISLIAQKIKIKKSLRKKASYKKTHLFDLRRTMRKNFRQRGGIIELAWKIPKKTKTRIVLICDVSGSMECYSRFLIQFLYALQNSLGNVETFVFSTRLSRLTPILKRKGFEEALKKISRMVLDWSGGTDIGGCLMVFNRKYAPTLLYWKSIVIIISDGWDRGDENLLREEMKRLKKKAHRIIWLNPLLGSSKYQPICKGMKTALPFLDQFLPVHNLKSIVHLGEVLHRIC